MKKILYTLLAAFALVSCMEEIDKVDTRPEGNVVLTVFNSTMTKAITNPDGLEYERKLESLDCFFYVKGQTNSPCVYYQRLDPVPDNALDDGRAHIPLNVSDDVLKAMFPGANTTCDVFLIANLPANTAYAANAEGTEVSSLNKTLLTMAEDGAYDGINKPFAMAGLDIATKAEVDRKVSVTGVIPLYRAAAKITISVNIPSSITTYVTKFDGEGNILRDENGEPIKEAQIMQPVFTENQNGSTVVPLQSSFHNGVNKTYLRADYVDGSNSLINEEDYFDTSKHRYVPSGSSNDVHTFTCEVPFYSYARAWERGTDNAAYISFEMPWRNATTGGVHNTYYYQIPINIKAQENNPANCFMPNHWYDITANIGVLGSTVESQPHLIGDMTFYVLDWTTEPETEHGDRYEDVVMEKYTYLVVPEKRIEINNANTGKIPYNASHSIKWTLEWPGSMEGLDPLEQYNADRQAPNLPFDAFYVFSGGAKGTDPVAREMTTIQNTSFSNQDGYLLFTHALPDNVYSPIYAHLKIWLDIDNNNTLDDNEANFVEYVTLVQYPPIYVIPHKSVEYSVYVNNYTRTNANAATSALTTTQGGVTYNLGYAKGTDDGEYQYTINVTRFNADDEFNYYDTPTKYIIGDPRSRSIDNKLNSRGTDMSSFWVEAPATYPNSVYENGAWTNSRDLTYYYPTSTEEGAHQIIAPKFRVVSFFSSGGSTITPEGAAMRCASFQENGYPAGRWRLPTSAEVAFIIDLQHKNMIQPIFYDNNYYYSSTDRVQNYVNSNPKEVRFSSWSNDNSNSTRCVYDEWYWGSEPEAKKNPLQNYEAGKQYVFTWGDEPR